MCPDQKKPHEGSCSRVLPVGIQARLFLLIALVLLPMVLLLTWTNYQRYKSRRQSELQTEVEVAQGIATTFEAYVNGVRKQLFTTAQALHRLSPHTQAQVTQLLTETAEHFPRIRHLNWISRDGTVLSSNLPEAIGHNISDLLYFQEIRAGQPWTISDLHTGFLAGDFIFAIAVAARDDAGSLQGVVVAGIGPEELRALTLSMDRPAQGAFGLFDQQGVPVYFNLERPFTWEERVRWRQSDLLLQQALATGVAQTGIWTPPLNGREWLSSRVPIHGIGWIAGAARPAEVAFAQVRRSLMIDLIVAFLITSAAFLLAYVLARTISTPLRRLEHDARVIGSGKIPMGKDWNAPGEVQSLRESVSAMATTLVFAKKAAEEASRAKSEFLANMSHELRTPMTVIMGSLEFLQRTTATPEERQLLDIATTSADRLLAIIDDLLDIARIEAGKLKIEERQFDLRECVQQTVEMFSKRGEEKGVRLRWEVNPQVPSQVRGDPDRLGQVLINLVGNAVKFTENGEIAVMVTRVGEELLLSVCDTGIGIPGDQIGQLFQPFTQVDSSLTRRYGGTGLGLAISKELVALMGGAIRVESEDGRGSTFTFTIPLRSAEALEESHQPDKVPIG